MFQVELLFKKGNENWMTHYLFGHFTTLPIISNQPKIQNIIYKQRQGIYKIKTKLHLSMFVKLNTYTIAPPDIRYLPFQNLKVKKCRNGRSSI